MKWTLIGKLVEVGDLPGGTGFVMEVGDKSITVTGLDDGMVKWLAKSYGRDIGLGFDSNDELKRLRAGSPPETSAAPSCPPCQLELGGKRCGDCGYAPETRVICTQCGGKKWFGDVPCSACNAMGESTVLETSAVHLKPSEAASFDKALARSPRRVSETKSSEGYEANGSLVAECPSTHSGHHIPGEKYKVCWYCQL